MPRKKLPKPTFPEESWIYAPEGIGQDDFPEVVVKFPDDRFEPLSKHWDKVLMILNVLEYRQRVLKGKSGTIVRLKAEYLGPLVGGQTYLKPIRQAMNDAGLLIFTGYKEDVYSMGYRKGPRLAGVTFRRHPIDDAKNARRFEKWKASNVAPGEFWLPVHHHLAKYVKQVEVDWEQAVAAIEELDRLPPKRRTRKNPDPMPKGVAARHQLAEIHRGNIFHHPCKYGRFHSSYSTLCRELRSCLMIDGRFLAEIDIKNSQPYFLSVFIAKELARLARPKLLSKGIQRGDSEENIIRFQSCTWLERFRADVCSGQLYETFAEDLKTTRSRAKSTVFWMLFDKVETMLETKVGAVFRRRYPEVFEFVVDMKLSGSPDLEEDDKHSVVGQTLQRLESGVIIETVCERFRVELPDVPVVSVHDSLLVYPEYLDVADAFIKEALTQFGEPLPKLKPTRARDDGDHRGSLVQDLGEFLTAAPAPQLPSTKKR